MEFRGEFDRDFDHARLAVFTRLDGQVLRRRQDAGNSGHGDVHDDRHLLHVARAENFDLDRRVASRRDRDLGRDRFQPRALRFRDGDSRLGTDAEEAGVTGVEEGEWERGAFDGIGERPA